MKLSFCFFTVCAVQDSVVIENACTCPVNTYLSDDQQECTTCPTGTSTGTITGATSVDACNKTWSIHIWINLNIENMNTTFDKTHLGKNLYINLV